MSSLDFPTLIGLAWNVGRSPIFRNLVQETASQRTARAALATSPRWKWSFNYDVIRQDGVSFNELKTLVGFYCARLGNWDTFLYTDADDNAVTAQAGGSGNGIDTQFQLVRAFGTSIGPVQAPVLVSNLTVNGVAKSQPGDYTVDNATGIITFAVAPPNGHAIVYDVTYKWRCTFVEEEIEPEKFNSKFWLLRGLEIISEK